VILRMFEKNLRLSLRGGKAILRKKGLNISCDTIRRRLLAHEVKFRSTVKKPLLSKKHVEKRFTWAKENLDCDWDKVIFSNEVLFGHILPFIMLGLSTSIDSSCELFNIRFVWSYFSKQGFDTLHIFTDNLNAAKMVKIYQRLYYHLHKGGL